MDYRLLGRTGVSVSPLCLGTMMFGPWGNDDRADAIRVIHRALDAGINFVDTADVYSGGVSEEITGEALRGRRDDVVLATKFFMPMDDRPNQGGGSRKWIMQEAENSLRRLQTDYIDLYQVHRPSATTDVEETLGALTDLVRQGKVRYIGSSSYSASQIVEAQWASRERNLARFVTEQPPYSILVRGIEEDVHARRRTGQRVHRHRSGRHRSRQHHCRRRPRPPGAGHRRCPDQQRRRHAARSVRLRSACGLPADDRGRRAGCRGHRAAGSHHPRRHQAWRPAAL
jgi:aryl-alcohol dehydrogenase-like predicted oxidoreductase